MRVSFDSEGSMSQLTSRLAEFQADPAVATILVFGCDANDWTAAELDPLLQGVSKPVLGGVFPQIVVDARNHERGTLTIGLSMRVEHCLLTGLSDPSQEPEHEQTLQAAGDAWADVRKGTLVVLVDGLSSRIAHLLDLLFDNFSLDKNIIGGGAGSLSLQQKPCIITPQGLVQDAALLLYMPIASALGVAHGWEAISASFKVTEAEHNTIRSLDWRPALEVYSEVVGAHLGAELDLTDFFATSKAYPFGIPKIGNELIVRDPIMVDERGGLVCVGEVPEGSFVRVLHGAPDDLIAGARQASATARERFGTQQLDSLAAVFVVDCISRVLFLGERMQEELGEIGITPGVPVLGMLTLGEIANSGNDYLEFYNKTCVVTLLEAHQPGETG
jgi:hypothetical protein